MVHHGETREGAYRLSFDRAAIDSKVSKIGKQFLGTVLTLNQLEEVGGIVDELRRNLNLSIRPHRIILPWSRSYRQ